MSPMWTQYDDGRYWRLLAERSLAIIGADSDESALTALADGVRSLFDSSSTPVSAPEEGRRCAVLIALANQAILASERRRLQADAEAKQRRLDLVRRVSAAVHSVEDLDPMLERLLQEVLQAVGAQRGAAMVADHQRHEIRLRVAIGYPPGDLSSVTRRLFVVAHPDEDIYASVVRTGRQLVIGGDHPARNRPNVLSVPAGFRVLTPIGVAGEPIGVFSVVWTEREETSEDTLSLLRLIAEQVGGALARARLVEAERLARARLTTALRNSGTVVYAYDAKGTITYLEGDTETLLGWPADALIGQDLRSLLDDEQGFEQRLRARRSGDRAVRRGDGRVRRRDGEVRHVVGTEGALDDAKGGAAGAITDVTALHRLQAERATVDGLRARADGAVRTGRAVAHELATPLGVILTLAELLAADRRLPDDVHDDLRVLAAQAEAIGRLLQRFSRIVSYEEVATPVGLQLDVERASPAGPSEG